MILNRELSAAAQSQEIVELFGKMQLRPIAEPLDKVQERMTREFNNWETIVKASTPRT